MLSSTPTLFRNNLYRHINASKTLEDVNLEVHELDAASDWDCNELRCILQVSIEARGKLLIFASPKNVKRLFESSSLSADAFFKPVPKIYQQSCKGQILGIHAEIGGFDAILAWVLMPGKTRAMYDTVFQFFKDLASSAQFRIEWQRIRTDFELAVMKSVKSVYPHVKLSGCYFHFCQCIYRRIQASAHLQSQYSKATSYTRAYFKRIMALPFIPPGAFSLVFEVIHQEILAVQISEECRSVPWRIAITAFADYFRRQWLHNGNVAVSVISCYGSMNNTISPIEGFHRDANKQIRGGASIFNIFPRAYFSLN